MAAKNNITNIPEVAHLVSDYTCSMQPFFDLAEVETKRHNNADFNNKGETA